MAFVFWLAISLSIDVPASGVLSLPEGEIAGPICLTQANSFAAIQGKGIDKTILHADGDLLSNREGVIHILGSATAPAVGIAISDLTIRGCATWPRKANLIYAWGTQSLQIRRCKFVDCPYEGIQTGAGPYSLMTVVEDCQFVRCGNGGALYPNTTAGCNVNGAFSVIRRNRFEGCGQGIECAGSFSQIVGNEFCRRSNLQSIGVNIGSSGAGIDGLVIAGNVFRAEQGIQAGNSIGTLANTTIAGNLFDNSMVSVAGGLETNSVANAEHQRLPPLAIHGTSLVAQNMFRFDQLQTCCGVLTYTAPRSYPSWGKENLKIVGNYFDVRDTAGNAFPTLVSNGTINGTIELSQNRMPPRIPPAFGVDIAAFNYASAGAEPLPMTVVGCNNSRAVKWRSYGDSKAGEITP